MPSPVIIPNAAYLHRLHLRLQERLPMWVVYRPITYEYPGKWVARMHITLPQPKSTRFVMTHDTKQALRSLLPPWLVLLERQPADAPEIEEVWI